MSDLRIIAYYFSFEKTGVIEIDEILSAIAHASKAYHHTEYWDDEVSINYEEFYPHLVGRTPIDWIQNAAIRAAAVSKKLNQKDALNQEKRVELE